MINWSVLQKRFFSKTTKLFWLFLLPSLVCLNLFLFQLNSNVPAAIFTVITLSVSWVCYRYRLKGLVISAAVLTLTFILIALFSNFALTFSNSIWIASMAMLLPLAMLTKEECTYAFEADKNKHQEEIEELKNTYERNEEFLREEVVKAEELVKQQQLEQDKLQKHHQKLNSVNIAIKEESDKYYSECEQLFGQITELKKVIGTYQEKNFQEKSFEKLCKKQRKMLNHLRTELFQARLFLENFRKNNQLLEVETKTPSNLDTETLQSEIQNLSSTYEELLRKYSAIKDKFQTFFQIDQMLGESEEKDQIQDKYEELKHSFEAYGAQLAELRFEIFQAEGTLLEHKFVKKEDPKCIQSYLSIADKECLRLEKENQILKDLLSKSFKHKLSSKL